MMLEFDFSNVNTVEFGVGKDNGDDQDFFCIPVDGDVQSALREMAEATCALKLKNGTTPLTATGHRNRRVAGRAIGESELCGILKDPVKVSRWLSTPGA